MLRKSVNSYLDGIDGNEARIKREGRIIRGVLTVGRIGFGLLPFIKLGLIIYFVRSIFV